MKVQGAILDWEDWIGGLGRKTNSLPVSLPHCASLAVQAD